MTSGPCLRTPNARPPGGEDGVAHVLFAVSIVLEIAFYAWVRRLLLIASGVVPATAAPAPQPSASP